MLSSPALSTVSIFAVMALALLILAGLSIIVSTLKTGISPMMSSAKARNAMLKLVDEQIPQPFTRSECIMDLGSGWGTLVIALAKQYPQHTIIGYELSWFAWMVSWLLKKRFRLKNLTLYRRNFHDADLNQATIVCCYLYTGGMQKLHKQLMQQQHQPLLIISNTFALPNHPCTQIIRLNDFYRSPIYLYHWQPTRRELSF